MKTLNLLIDELISRIEALGNQINLSLDSLSAIKKFIQQLRDSINQLEENNANTTSQLSRKLLRLADKLKEEKRQYTLSINQLKEAVISLGENTEKIIKSYEENSEYFRQKMEETERQVEDSGGNLANSLISWGRKIKDIQQELEEFKEAVESQAETTIERGKNWEKTLMATPASLRETLKEFTRHWQNSERQLREKTKTLRITLSNKHKQLRETVKQQNQKAATEIQNHLNTEILAELLSRLEASKNLMDSLREKVEYHCENLTTNLEAVTNSLRDNGEMLREINSVCQDSLETVKSIE